MAATRAYVREVTEAGVDVDTFAPRLSFFFVSQSDFFEEIAKFRAARRLWARIMRERFGATDERSQMLRFHTQTGGATLTAQQPENNIVRTTLEALSAVLGGTQSLHTNSYDEALALPTEASAKIALRTQQVIGFETGVGEVVDPLGGSWYVEALTGQIEAEANAIFDKILAMGGSDLTHADTEGLATATRSGDSPVTKGLLRGIEEGWFMSEIAEAAFQYQTALEKGDKKIVGVNVHTDSMTSDLDILRVSHEVEIEQVRELSTRRTSRDGAAVTAALQHLVEVGRTEGNMIESILDACRVEATLGEICDALRAEWGEYREPARF
jgi:methylmalonyl-CoA mutase N-terminal domain/subunit